MGPVCGEDAENVRRSETAAGHRIRFFFVLFSVMKSKVKFV